MKRNSATIWLLLALILGSYSIYIFSSTRGESTWGIVSGIVLVVAALVALLKFLRGIKTARIDRSAK
ncbi:hypothetical protein J2805_004301 [Arthrobacter oryzae]|nr:hypothetical protein [Arthrobacter oryzae]